MKTTHTPGPGASPEAFETQCPDCGLEAGACICPDDFKEARMETKHDPRKWTFSNADAIPSLMITQPAAMTVREGLDAVCVVLMPAFEKKAGKLAEARARLIAAAPELLAALEMIELVNHPDADQHNPLVKGAKIGEEIIDRIVTHARAALSAARGQK